MLPTTSEVAAALRGAIRLARLDPRGLVYFDTSLGGFWRSFFAAVIVAPAYLLLTVLPRHQSGEAASFHMIAVETISYVIGWLAFPCLMLLVVDLLNRRERYFDFMVPYNWVNIPQAGLLLLVEILDGTGLLPAPVYHLLLLFAFGSILIYQWFVARVGLSISGIAAVGMVLLNEVVDLSIGVITQSLLKI